MGLGIEEFSRIVSRIHAVEGRPAAWEAVLADIAHTLEATAATVITDTGSARTVLATTITPEAAASYQDYYWSMDFVAKSFEQGSVGLIRDGWDLSRRHTDTEYFNDWQLRYDMTDGMFVRLAAPVPTSLAISAPPRDEPFASPERFRFLNALIPHLDHALHTRHLLSGEDRGVLAVGEAADFIRHGIIVVGRGGRVVGMNTAAQRITAAGDGLRCRGNIIEASSPDRDLHAAITTALHPRPPTPRAGSHLVCRRPSGAHPYIVRISPLDEHDDPRDARAAIIIVDTEQRPQPPLALLRQVFGLTLAESTVAQRLIDGVSLRVIADELALSIATVKTHLHHVFIKTGTHRQTELLRLLLELNT